MKARGRLIREPSLEVGREKTSLLFIGNYASSTAPPPSARSIIALYFISVTSKAEGIC